MAIQTGDSDDVVSEINVTPLVDVMLVLLVVFIITAPLLGNSIKVQLPQTAATAKAEQVPAVTVSVDDQGYVYVDKERVSLEGLEPELKRLRAERNELSVQLSADQSSNYGLVAKVMAAVNRAGVSKLSVLSLSE